MAGYAFDAQYYLSTYPDVAAAVSRGQFASAEDHFNQFGRFEGRDPNQFFDTSFYLSEYPDVTNAGVNPLTHFLTFGSTEARVTNANIEATLDLNNNGSLGDDFNSSAYLAQYPDVAAAVAAGQTTAISHFLQFGQFEGRVATLTNGTTVTGPLTNTGGASAPATALTTGIDTLTGTAGNDTFRGDNTTVQAGDTINGGAGRDTFSYTDSSAGGVNPTLTTNSVEVINVRNISVASAGTPGSAETATVTFGALAAGETIAVAGRTITAGASGATASEVQQAFLTNTAVGGATPSGTLSSTYSTSTGSTVNTVVLTANTVGNQTDLTLGGTNPGSGTIAISQGTAAVPGSSAPSAVNAANFVGATDFASDNSTGAVTFNNLAQGQTVSLNGNGLANTGALTANYATAATSAVINLSNTVGSAAIDLNGTGLTTATINSTVGANSVGTFDVAGAKTINVNASTAFTTSGITTGGTASTLNVSGGGKVALGTLDNNITTINAAAASGGVSLTAGNGAVKFTGSTGADSIVFGANFASTDVVDGGAGRDTVSLNGDNFTAANSDVLKGLNALTGVEVLEFTGSTGVTISGGTASTSFTNSTVDQLVFNTADAGTDTVELAGARLYSFGADNTGAATFNSAIGQNTLNLSFIGDSTAGGNAADVTTLTSTGATTINIASTGATTGANTITTLTAATNATVNITGSQALTIGGSTNGAVIDGSTATGKLTITGSASADIIKGGAGNDIITGGAGADTLTGGAGNDQFKFAPGSSTATTIDHITDLNLGTGAASGAVDTLSFDLATAGTANIVTLTTAQQTAITGAANFAAALDAAIGAANGAANNVVQFTYGSDTYIAVNGATAGATFDAAADVVVKVTGLTGTLDATDIVIS